MMTHIVRRMKRLFIAFFVIGLLLSLLCMALSRREGRIVLYSPNSQPIHDYSIKPIEETNAPLPFEIVRETPVPCGLELRLRVLSPFSGWYTFLYSNDSGGGMETVSLYALEDSLFWIDAVPQGSEALAAALLIGQVLLLVYLVFKFHALETQSPYSYRLAGVGTAVLFVLAILGGNIATAVRSIRATGSLTVDSVIDQITQTPFSVNRWLLPVLIVSSIAMLISNIALMRHEGVSLRHLLGAGMGLAAILVMLAGIRLETQVLYPLADESAVWYFTLFALKLFFGGLLCYAECMAVCIVIYAAKAAHYEPPMDRDFIIVPGCAIRKDGTLFPLLRGRVDRAFRFAQKQESCTGRRARFVPSGGQGSDECVSEAEAMTRYLIAQGIARERILPEDRSTNTQENMRFSAQLIAKESADAKIAFSTTNYHVLRVGLCAASVGLNALGMGSRTAWYFWPNAFAREMIGLLIRQKKQHMLVILLLLLFSVLLGALLYIAVI